MANGTALLALPAGPSPLPPAGWRCVEGRGAESGPTPSAPPPASRRRRGQGSPDAADTLRPASAVSRVAALPRGGEGRPAAAPCAPHPALCRCSWSAPGCPSGARSRDGGVVTRSRRPRRVRPVKCCGGRVGKVEGRHPFSSPYAGGRRVPRRVPPARVWRSGLDSDGRRAASHLPTLWERCLRGRSLAARAVKLTAAWLTARGARSRFSRTTASSALVLLRALLRLRPRLAEAVVRLPLPVPQTPNPRRRRPGALDVADGECPGSGTMPPSVRKPSLAIRRGCLGVPHPPVAAPRLRVFLWPALGAPPLRAVRGPGRCSSRPTAARASPHRVGGGSRTGPGPASPAAVAARVAWARAAPSAARRGVWGSGRLRLRRLPLLRVERLSARSRPEPRPVGAARARVVPPRSGGSFPGVWVSRAATGRLEREKTDAFGGFTPGGAKLAPGAPGGGAGHGPGSREGGVEAGRRPGRRGAALVCGGGIPARLPGGPAASSALSRAPPPRAFALSTGAPVFRAASSSPLPIRAVPSRPGRYRGWSLAARSSPRPPHRGGRRLPRRGAPRARRRGWGGACEVWRGGERSPWRRRGPEVPREVRSLGGGERSQSAPRVPRDRLCCPEGPPAV